MHRLYIVLGYPFAHCYRAADLISILARARGPLSMEREIAGLTAGSVLNSVSHSRVATSGLSVLRTEPYGFLTTRWFRSRHNKKDTTHILVRLWAFIGIGTLRYQKRAVKTRRKKTKPAVVWSTHQHHRTARLESP